MYKWSDCYHLINGKVKISLFRSDSKCCKELKPKHIEMHKLNWNVGTLYVLHQLLSIIIAIFGFLLSLFLASQQTTFVRCALLTVRHFINYARLMWAWIMADFVFYNLFARLAISTVWLPFISHDLCLTLFPRSILSICVYIVLCGVVLVVIRSVRCKQESLSNYGNTLLSNTFKSTLI